MQTNLRLEEHQAMNPTVIVSYDESRYDRDALELGHRFAAAGASLALAYVRHAAPGAGTRESLAEQDAQALLDRGAQALGLPDVARHVVVNASTGSGLRELAERESAEVVVFGSDYRTAAGTVRPGVSAQRLLSGGPAAVAIAPAGLSDRTSTGFARIGVLSDGSDLAAQRTGRSLADAVGGQVVADAREGDLDLLVIGSRPEAEIGRVMLSAVTEYAIDLSRCPVLVVARGVAVQFKAPALASA
jgi:nucleotide-binding universal stress UspA family protein